MTDAASSHQLTRPQVIRALVVLVMSTFVALIGHFMMSPWLVFQLNLRGLPPPMIGWFSASSWLGLLLITPFAARIIRVLGRRRALLASLEIPLLTAVSIALVDHVLWWAAMAFLGGAAMSVRWIVTEACIAELTPARRRGRIISIYQTLLGMAFIFSPALLAWLEPTNPNTPWVVAGFVLAGLLITHLVPVLQLNDSTAQHTGLRGLIHAARQYPAIVIAGFVGGMFELGIHSMLPVYSLMMGFTASAAALLLSVGGVGSTVAMIPVGEAADRYPAQKLIPILIGTVLLACLSALGVAFWPAWLWAIAFIWGASGGALYTVSMISLSRSTHGSALISATAVLVLSYTLGGLLGPIIAGHAIELSDHWGLGIATAAVAASALWFVRHRKPAPLRNQPG